MGLIHQPKKSMTVREQFNHPLHSYRQLYYRTPFPYLRIIHMECHMNFFRSVLKDVVSLQNIKEEYPVQDIQSMLR